MKKSKLLGLIGLSLMALTIGACNQSSGSQSNTGSTHTLTTTYTVAFEVDGQRYKTTMVKDGETITDTIPDPTKEGYNFVGWYLGDELIDLSTYVVTANVTLTAKFEEAAIDQSLNVNDVKDPEKEYYLVLGWWECTDMKEDGVTPKLTSYLTETLAKMFYMNFIKYLTKSGASADQIAAISFRNYSCGPVSGIGAAVNADQDVDILIGVGNNINSSGAVSLYNSSNDYKFPTEMGTTPTDRYVACTNYATALGVSTYEWLKYQGAEAGFFKKVMSDAEMDAAMVPETLDLTVTVHGDTDEVTHLEDRNTAITMPTITVSEGKMFTGFATEEEGEVVLNVAKDATLKYDDLIKLVVDDANTLDLYPVIIDIPVVEDDLIVYVQVQGTNIRMGEAKLLESRYKAAHPDKNITFNLCEVSNGNAFTTAIGTNPVDVIIGGNSPLQDYDQDESGPLTNVGAMHFQNTTRKVIISGRVAADHKTLAKDLYDFVVADAPVFNLNIAFWQKKDKTWVTDDEMAAINAGMQGQLKTFLNLGESDSLTDKYNVVCNNVSFPKDKVSGSDKVNDLAQETQADFDGAGADLIIGCGSNIDDQEGYKGIPKKAISDSAHTFVAATSRYVALPHDNCLSRTLFDDYFVLPA